MCLFYANTILFYCSFVIWFEIKECEAPSFVLLSEGCFGYSESLWFHTNFRIIYSSSVNNVIGILIGIALSLYIPLGADDDI